MRLLSHSHVAHGGGDVSGMTPGQRFAWVGWRGVHGVGLGWVTALCAPPRGEPSSAHCKQRLSDGSPLGRANLCAPAPANRKRRAVNEPGESRRKAEEVQPGFPPPNLCALSCSATSRAGMAGWAGEGGGRFGERSEDEAPTLLSTHRQHDAVRPHTRQQRNTCPVKMRVAGGCLTFLWAQGLT
jgi:hypothetical protein